MAYSLFLGSGPVGQLEVFLALCKLAVDKGKGINAAIRDNYDLISRICTSKPREYPFVGYGTEDRTPKELMDRFHPFGLYREMAFESIGKLAFPFYAVEGNQRYYVALKQLVGELGLGGLVKPVNFNFVCREEPCYPGITAEILPMDTFINDLIGQSGYPSVVACAHFLLIAQHSANREYGGKDIFTGLPHKQIASFMGDNTLLMFLEEGHFVYDEGVTYAQVLGDDNLVNHGIWAFEKYAPQFFHLADGDHRKFDVRVYPKESISGYKREKADYGQILVVVSVSP
ncbi:MAG: hypothetical protein ABIG95_00395 [Candidatus Woesearchaeota archaeon]